MPVSDYALMKQDLIDRLAEIDTCIDAIEAHIGLPGRPRLPSLTSFWEWDCCRARLQAMRVLCPAVWKVEYNYYWRAETGYPYTPPGVLVANAKRDAFIAAVTAARTAINHLWVADQDAALNALQGTLHAYRKRIVASTLSKAAWGVPP